MALSLLALLLLAQDPISTAPVSTAPVSTAPVATAPAQPTPAPVAAPSGTPADPDYLPKGAPEDDFAFTAWCHGVLAGHMDLAKKIKDVMPLDPTQEEIGHAYLRGYDRALQHAPESKTEDGKKRAEAARLDGWNRWDAARKADKLVARDTYLAYQLPGRCEHAAERLANDPHLFDRAPSADEVAAMPITLSDGTVAPQVTSAPAASAAAPAGAGDGSAQVQMTSVFSPPAATGAAALLPPPGAVADAPAKPVRKHHTTKKHAKKST